MPEKPLCLAVLPSLGTVCGSAACGERQSAVVITHPLQALPPAKPEIAGRRVMVVGTVVYRWGSSEGTMSTPQSRADLNCGLGLEGGLVNDGA